MSHEIRTPLNAIIGMGDVLMDTELPPEKRRYLEILRNSGQILLTVVNDILDYSRLETGKITLEDLSFDILSLCRRVAQVIEPLAHQKSLRFSFECEADHSLWVRGDSKRMEQIVLNLLGNAVKFTETGGITFRISAVSHSEKTFVRLSVEDTGIGIQAEHISAIFMRSKQSDA